MIIIKSFAEFVPLPATEPLAITAMPTTMDDSTTQYDVQNVNQDSAGGGSGNNTKNIIAIALGVLILLIAVLVVAGIIAYRMRLFRQKQKKGKIFVLY